MEYWCDLADNPDTLARSQLTPQCHVLVQLESQDLWMTVCLRLHSPDFINFEASMDIKMDFRMHGHDIKVVMQKLSLSIWNQLCKENYGLHPGETMETSMFALSRFQVYQCIKLDTNEQISITDIKSKHSGRRASSIF